MAGEPLAEYHAKRRFEETPEPAGGDAHAGPPRFVVQEHHARALHWDFRLERDGVLVSWAVPKGVPADPKVNHLAVRTEDHPLDYYDFEGDIPAGNYGAGTVKLWDRGTYECEKWEPREVIVRLHGERVQGRYVLFQTGAKQWMLYRMDAPADPAREPMPVSVAPMLATLARLPAGPDDERYGYEIKWDGVRAITYVEGGRVRIETRNGNDVTRRYPELRELGRALGATACILDGEVVAFDDTGRPSFERLQRRMHVESDSALRRLTGDVPVVYMIFDLLWLDGHSTLEVPYRERRRLLEGLELSGPAWQTPSYHVGDGAALLDASRARGLEGIVAKRLDSPYEAGRRSRCWLKVKNHRGQELVVGGWLPGEGRRRGRIGALLVGYYDGAGADRGLRFAGRVGTGFSEAELDRLASLLGPLERPESPFTPQAHHKHAHYVEPRLVVAVEFSEWTAAGIVRHPVYKGLRDDKDPLEVVREVPLT